MKPGMMIVALLGLLLMGLNSPTSVNAGVTDTRPLKILFISSFSKDMPGHAALEKGLQESLTRSPVKHELFFEFMHVQYLQFFEALYTQHQRDENFQRAFAAYLKEKYQYVKPDYIVAWAGEANSFLDRFPDLLPGSKRIYLQRPELHDLQAQDLYVAFDLKENFRKCIEEFLAIAQPEHILAIGSENNSAARTSLAGFQSVIREIRPAADVEYLIDQPLDSLVARLATENREKTVVFYILTSSDGRGRQMTPESVVSTLTESSNIPVYGLFESFLGHGVVGGYTISLAMTGEILGAVLITGELQQQQVHIFPMRYAFDWSAFKKWNIDTALIPEQSIIINRPPVLLAEYLPHIIAGVIFILAQMVLIGLLVVNRNRLKKAESELRQHRDHLEHMVAERTRELQNSQQKLEAAKAVAKLGIWELDLVNNHVSWSDELYDLFELDKETCFPSTEVLYRIVHPADRASVESAYRNSLISQNKFKLAHRLLLKDGRIIWVETQWDTRFDEDGKPLYSLGTTYDITHQKEAEEKVNSYLELASDGIHILDEKGNVFECNKAFADTLGYSYEEAQRLNVKDWDVNSQSAEDRLRRVLIKSETFETIYKRKDGTTFDVLVSTKRIKLQGVTMLYASVRDITKQKQAVEERLAKERQLQAITDSSLDAIILMNPQGEITFWNPAAEQILGYQAEKVIGKNLHKLLAPERYLSEHEAAFPQFVREGTGNAVGKIIELHAKHKDGHEFPITLSICAIQQENQWHAVGTIRDITRQKAAEAELGRLLDDLVEASVTDKLTGLFNRRKLDESFEYEIQRAERYQSTFSVILLDMDHFKSVNDEYGHLVGDEVLQVLATILSSNIRTVDVLGRWGGEEFLIICPQADLASAAILAEKLRNAIEEHDFSVVGSRTCSFGVASWEAGENIDDVAARVDKALYRAKEQGRNCVVMEE